MIKEFILIGAAFLASSSVYSDSKVTYKMESGKLQCLNYHSSLIGKIRSSYRKWGNCGIDDINHLMTRNLKNDGIVRIDWYNAKPLINRDCGIKYNPKTGKSIYINCNY